MPTGGGGAAAAAGMSSLGWKLRSSDTLPDQPKAGTAQSAGSQDDEGFLVRRT